MRKSVRVRKVVRDLLIHKTRTFLIVLSIAVGLFALSVVFRTYAVLSRDLARDYNAINPTHATLFTGPFDEKMARAIERMPEIEQAEGVTTAWTRIQTPAGEWRTIRLFALDDFQDQRINRITSEWGTWPPPDRTIILERSSFTSAHYQHNDTLVLEALDGHKRMLPLVGLAHDLTVFPGEFSNLVLFGYVTRDTMEWLGVSRTMNELRLVVAAPYRNTDDVRRIADDVRERLERQGVDVTGVWLSDSGKHQLDSVITSVLLILLTLGVLSLILSAFLVVNTFSAFLAREIGQIGIMKTIGAPRHDIFGMYGATIVVFSLIALAVSLPLGHFGAMSLTATLMSLLNFTSKQFVVPVYVLGIELAAGLAVPFLAALYSILTGTHITVREAMHRNQLEAQEFGNSRFDELLKRVRWLSASLRYALRNMFRRKARLALTLAALSIGGAVFLSVLSVMGSISHTLDTIRDYWQQDVTVNFQRPYRLDQVQAQVEPIPGVETCEGWTMSQVFRLHTSGRETDQSITLFGIPLPTSFIEPRLLEGRWLQPGDTNALVVNAYFLAEEPDVQPGDTIVLKSGEKETLWTVVGIVTAQMVGPGIPRLQHPMAYANVTTVARTFGKVGYVNRLAVQTRDQSMFFQAMMADMIETELTRANIRMQSIETNAMMDDQLHQTTATVSGLLIAMAIIFAVVGSLGLMGTMSLNILERTREIGVLRAIGASDGILMQTVLAEGVSIGVLSWLIAVVLAVPLSRILSYFVGINLTGTPLLYVFPLWSMLAWLLLVVGLSLLASYVPARSATRLCVRDMVTYE